MMDFSRRVVTVDEKEIPLTPTEYDILRLLVNYCLLYTSPSPRDRTRSRMPSSAWKKKKKQNKNLQLNNKLLHNNQ